MARPCVLPGIVAPENAGALDWSFNGLIAFGCQTVVVIVDPGPDEVRIVQTLDGLHKAPVVRARWSPALMCAESPCLASGDSRGVVVVWDVFGATPTPLVSSHISETKETTVSRFSVASTAPAAPRVADLQWHPSLDHLLLVLYSDFTCTMWDVNHGRELWSFELEIQAVAAAFDPFGANRVCFSDEEVKHPLPQFAFTACVALPGLDPVPEFGDNWATERAAGRREEVPTCQKHSYACHGHPCLLSCWSDQLARLLRARSRRASPPRISRRCSNSSTRGGRQWKCTFRASIATCCSSWDPTKSSFMTRRSGKPLVLLLACA